MKMMWQTKQLSVDVQHAVVLCGELLREGVLNAGEPYASAAKEFLASCNSLFELLDRADFAAADRHATTLADPIAALTDAVEEVRDRRARGALRQHDSSYQFTIEEIRVAVGMLDCVVHDRGSRGVLDLLVKGHPAKGVSTSPPVPHTVGTPQQIGEATKRPSGGTRNLSPTSGASSQATAVVPVPAAKVTPVSNSQPKQTTTVSASPSPVLATPIPMTAPLAHASKVRIQRADLRSLKPHALNSQIFHARGADEEKALRDDIRAHGLHRRIEVCGDGCASPPGTILAGHRRVGALLTLGYWSWDVLVVDELSADAEECILLNDNIEHPSRKLTQSELSQIEERLRKLWDRRPGQRSDLVSAGVVSTLDPGIQGSTAGRTDRLIANKTGQSVSEVRRRHRVFGSPLLTPEVREKLDSGSTSLKKVAETIVAIEGEPVVRDAVLAYRRGPSNPANTKTIDEAKDALKARISASPTPAPSEPNVMTVSLSLAETPEGTFIGEVASPWGGRRDRLEVTVEPRNTGLVVTITQRRVQTMLMRKP